LIDLYYIVIIIPDRQIIMTKRSKHGPKHSYQW